MHNLGRLAWGQPDAAYDWARSFDEEAQRIMTESPGDIATLVDHPAYELASPTPDHLLPLFYLAGLASAAGTTCEKLIGGYALGSLSMTSYALR